MKRVFLITTVCALLVIAASPAVARAPQTTPAPACHIQGSWLSQVDIGGTFFVQYSGTNSTGGALTIEWIRFDPTLFGNFPTAVRVTQGVGAWKGDGQGYEYTWVAYAIDKDGAPVYSVKTSGTGAFDGCDAIAFDYVLEVFPAPMNPLTDSPAVCLSGKGAKVRIPVVRGACQ